MSLFQAGSLPTSIPSGLFKEVTFTNASAQTINGGALKEFAVTTTDDLTGYAPTGLSYLDSGNINLVPVFYFIKSLSSINVDLRNVSNDAVTLAIGKCIIKGIFVKTS